MRRALLTVLLVGFLKAELPAQEAAKLLRPVVPGQQAAAAPDPVAAPPAAEPSRLAEEVPWQPVWGLVGLRVIDGPRVAPNGQEYHP
jgi:hypothetical protein